ncbi:hypothetical protein [Saccharopolyspora spinosa]|uniref:hypothetical protein n=1 Tax=Saccharopolyspora spinosa TaxID=60894 RepID=UPI0002379DA9|nr:hypothetical protein [Saccharopolyspora spinosa]
MFRPVEIGGQLTRRAPSRSTPAYTATARLALPVVAHDRLELGVSVASAAVRGEATGCPANFRGGVVSVAKRALKAGEILDGAGGYLVYGRLAPAGVSLKSGALPMGVGAWFQAA